MYTEPLPVPPVSPARRASPTVRCCWPPPRPAPLPVRLPRSATTRRPSARPSPTSASPGWAAARCGAAGSGAPTPGRRPASCRHSPRPVPVRRLRAVAGPRPLRPLVDSLARLGATVRSADGTLPPEVTAAGLDGGEPVLDGSPSSQYLSGLLMAAPL
ncbi:MULTISPECIES: hypothetical protein [Streptomyces]|uniref:hypothetical protein n=1 Tax=Streptomyces TaxID=1883 RepID=UPI001E2EE678|nr:hypothetical protein [Streptomyces ruber]